MRLIHWLSLCLVLTAPCGLSRAEEKPAVFFVQLVRGTGEPKAPEPNAKPISPELSHMLVPKFRWKHYWELSRQEAKVTPGQVTKISLKVRDLEMQLVGEDLELRLYQDKQLVRTARQKLKNASLEIMGGAKDNDDAWFVVVRRDRPH